MSNKKQDRRSINLPTGVYEEISYLQAKTRLIMKERGEKLILGKTSLTKILEVLILSTPAEKIADLLK